MIRSSLLVGATVLATDAPASELGDAGRGEKLFSQCKGCHQIGRGAENRIGPHLNTLFGRKAGGLEDFRYSKSMARAGAAGLEWHAETLDGFLENPRSIASGTRMSYRGMKDDGQRADLIAYLRVHSDSPRDIPEADPTASGTDHDVDPEILAIAGDPEYGEYLSSECKTCHQSDGGDDGIPSITLWPVEDFVVAMHAYKEKKRQNPVMQMMAGRLSNEEIAALAAYFGALEED
ncbi:cytochrome C [Oceanicola sp. 22II-s10i]|uniref:c-type cytochrome n=1 Tax=Oceanicola sp. 22II-s10i TaxID=1317116 RepID=UPI000B74AEAC|nr:c-type cytochrome [Oceanicola sp. 22II-s10i]OWU83517.1 cytochrome C [Oceanicola sp. 22II-s10i]